MEWMILPLKRYADFKGRSRRMEYWMFILFVTLMALALAIGVGLGGFSLDSTGEDGGAVFYIVALLGGLFFFGILIPMIAVAVRRLHDRNLSGWWYLAATLFGFIPVIGFLGSIAFLVVMLLPGTDGPNRFGEDPKDPHSADVFA